VPEHLFGCQPEAGFVQGAEGCVSLPPGCFYREQFLYWNFCYPPRARDPAKAAEFLSLRLSQADCRLAEECALHPFFPDPEKTPDYYCPAIFRRAYSGHCAVAGCRWVLARGSQSADECVPPVDGLPMFLHEWRPHQDGSQDAE
jgi:hypothetical protein